MKRAFFESGLVVDVEDDETPEDALDTYLADHDVSPSYTLVHIEDDDDPATLVHPESEIIRAAREAVEVWKGGPKRYDAEDFDRVMSELAHALVS